MTKLEFDTIKSGDMPNNSIASARMRVVPKRQPAFAPKHPPASLLTQPRGHRYNAMEPPYCALRDACAPTHVDTPYTYRQCRQAAEFSTTPSTAHLFAHRSGHGGRVSQS